MTILNSNWLTTRPLDYELKKYTFLSAYKKFEGAISNNDLYSTLQEIEFHLNELYKLKYKKDELDDSRRIVKGINLDLMELDYDYLDEDEDITTIYEIIEYAIKKLEDLHMQIRIQWRNISDKIRVTEIPDRKPTKKKGIIFVILNDHIKVYSYINPTDKDWQSLVLKEEFQLDNTLRKIAETISASERISNDNRFWRFDPKGLDLDKISYDDAILPIIRHILFYKLRVS